MLESENYNGASVSPEVIYIFLRHYSEVYNKGSVKLKNDT
jgi:hypothetical protein